MYPEVDYFATVPNTEEYDFDGVSATLTIWYRSLSAMSESFTAAGFRISAISEPPVSPDTPPELLPPSESDPTRFIGFIFFALEASPTVAPESDRAGVGPGAWTEPARSST
jgi:hypothetical protein